VLRYRIHLEQRGYAPATVNVRLAAVRAHRVRSGRRRPPESRPGGRYPSGEGAATDRVRLGNWLTPEQGRRLLECSPASTARCGIMRWSRC
jgi:hypothetical protein